MAQNLFLYRIQLTRFEVLTEGPTEAEDQLIGQHADYLEQLTRQGVALLVGRTLNLDPSNFGMCLFRADSEVEANAVMNNDPAVKAGIFKATLFPFRLVFLGDFTGLP